MNRSFFGWYALPFVGYFGLTTLITWPIVPKFMTHIPGGGDAFWFLWQLWWFKHALLDLRQSPFVTDLIYYPLTDVPVTIQTPINEFFTLPIQVAFGVVPLYNFLFLMTYVLSGYFTYLLGLSLIRRRDLAFMGGVIFAFCAYRGMRGLGHLSLLTTQWMPLALLLTSQCWRRPSWQRGIATGLVGALVALSSPYYVMLFMLPVLASGGIYLLIQQRHNLWRKALWQAGTVAAVILLLIVSPFYGPLLLGDPEIHAINQSLAQSAWQFSADLLAWVLPPGFHPIWGRYTAPIYQNFTTPNLMETTIFVGLIPFLLAVFSVSSRQTTRSLLFWQLLALLSMLLALGPDLHVNGNKIIGGLPFHWLSYLPGFDVIRIPSRAGITTTLAVSLLAMITLDQIRRRFAERHWRLIWPLITLLILIDITPFIPYPTSATSIPDAYTEIAESADRLALLELPAGELAQSEENFFAEVSWYMYYQSYHQKPMVSGYLGRRPARLSYPERHLPFVRQFFYASDTQHLTDMPPLGMLPDPFWPDEIRRGQESLAQQGIGHVLVHCLPAHPTYCIDTNVLMQQSLGMPQHGDDTLTHYRVEQLEYTTAYAPAYLTTPPLDFGPAFSNAEINANGRLRTLLQQSGTITLTIPFSGVWSIAGTLVGDQAKAIAFSLDDRPRAPPSIDIPNGITIGWEEEMGPGIHKLQVLLPSNPIAGSRNESYYSSKSKDETELAGGAMRENRACEDLCLQNIHVTLIKPLFATNTPPLATFVTESDQRLELLATTIFTMGVDTQAVPQPQLLMNTWRLDDKSYTELHNDPTQMPTNYIHLTDEAGNTLAQADHPLGERRLELADGRIIFDLVSLPPADATATPTGLRIGLWYPQTQRYFWSPDAAETDAVGRVKLGKLTDFSRSLSLPSLPMNRQVAATFENSSDGRSLHLLDAYVMPHPNDEAQLQLATVWAQTDLFIPKVSVTLFAHLTDDTGKTLATVEHTIGPHQLTWHKRIVRYDQLNLPTDLGDGTHEVRIGLWYPDTGQRYQANRPDLIDAEDRLRLGTISELKRAK